MTRLNLGDPPDGRDEQTGSQEAFTPWVWTACALVLVAVVAVVLFAMRPDWMPSMDPYASGSSSSAGNGGHNFPH